MKPHAFFYSYRLYLEDEGFVGRSKGILSSVQMHQKVTENNSMYMQTSLAAKKYINIFSK